MFPLALGLDTFGDVTHDAEDRPDSCPNDSERVGDFPMPAADVALGAIAGRTERMRLGSAVTVLSSVRRRRRAPAGYSIVRGSPAGPEAASITTACTLTNSRIPWVESSRP